MKINSDFRVLVVEDEALISMLIEDMLADIGCACVDVAPSVEAAIEALQRTAPHFAMLDINLNGKRSFPVADVLKEREIPFIFLSGYGSHDLDERYTGSRILQKPFVLGDLALALEDALG